MTSEKRVRHILSLSGGKDSAALAIYLRDRVPEMEYIFSDTRKELPETYEYLQRISNYLGKEVTHLNADVGFDHWYEMYGGMIPSNHRRWCTRALKLKPFEQYCGNDEVVNYVGLRADEDRSGYISHKPNIKAVYPFREDGLVLRDIEEILRNSGVGMLHTHAGAVPARDVTSASTSRRLSGSASRKRIRTCTTRPRRTKSHTRRPVTSSRGARGKAWQSWSGRNAWRKSSAST